MPPGHGSPALLLITVASALSACGESKDPIVIEAIAELAEDALREEDSAYEELLEGIDEREANDGLGHLDQRAITRWVRDGSIGDKLEYLFDHGDELTEIQFTAQDGIGSLKTFSRFSRYPTEGLFTGPNASSCGSCHDQPLGNGGGLNVANVVQDPQPNVGGTFNVRNTRNMNGDSWLQLAGMEMTVELQAVRASLREQALRAGVEGVSSPLTAKGINFGTLTCSLPSGANDVLCDYSQVRGVSIDLVVRSGGWKGNHATIRAFSEDALFGEMGIHSDRFAYHVQSPGQALPGDIHLDPPDVDEDGVAHELSVGDVTALTLYLASQAPPTTLLELASENKLRLTPDQVDRINGGEVAFSRAGCDECHKLELRVESSIFGEPDRRRPAYYDYLLADTNNGYDIDTAVTLDLSSSPVVERHIAPTGEGEGRYFSVKAMTDLKRHFLGDHLCDEAKVYTPVDAAHIPAQVPADAEDQSVAMTIDRCEWVTADLWGIGGTAPYLHDGRATTLREAILAHCSEGERVGEADAACRAFSALPESNQDDMVAFLRSQVMEPEPEPELEPEPEPE